MRSGRNKQQIDPNLKPEELQRQGYARCIRLLGSREHSSTELRTKLANVGFESDTIDAVLQQLIESGYQSDQRFAQLYSEQLLRKHYGPMGISAKLSARGIGSSLARESISAAIAESGLTWAEAAADALLSRFSMMELSESSNPGSDNGGSEYDESEYGGSEYGGFEHSNATEHDANDFVELTAEQRDEQREQAQRLKAKYARFLNRRGFSTTDSIKAIRLAAETVSE